MIPVDQKCPQCGITFKGSDAIGDVCSRCNSSNVAAQIFLASDIQSQLKSKSNSDLADLLLMYIYPDMTVNTPSEVLMSEVIERLQKT